MSDAPSPPKPEDPATIEEMREMLARTREEERALEALAGDPDGQALEALRQHLRHEAEAAARNREARA